MLLAQEPMDTNVLVWWQMRDHDIGKPADPSMGRPEGLPHLAQMARQWLGCPATSAGVERLFSKHEGGCHAPRPEGVNGGRLSGAFPHCLCQHHRVGSLL